MKKMLSALLFLGLALASACGPAATVKTGESSQVLTNASGTPATASTAAAAGLSSDALPSYSATFEVRFEGSSSWNYLMSTRRSPSLREVNLHIEGVDKSQNPGDIRVVTDGKTTWMSGAGTDNECILFPNNEGMDPQMIEPASLIPGNQLSGLLVSKGAATAAGRKSQHFTASIPSAAGWSSILLDMQRDQDSGALLVFAMQATGEDPFFKAGQGTIRARYAVSSLDTPQIEPVKGCEISVPLPKNISKLVRLPGLVSFNSPDGIDALVSAFQSSLPQAGWNEADPPSKVDGATQLSYARNAEQVQVQIEVNPTGGSTVKLIFLQK